MFHIPYADIHEPVTVYTDEKKKRQAVQYYDGLDAYIYTDIGTKKAESYELFVAKDKKKYVRLRLYSAVDEFLTRLPRALAVIWGWQFAIGALRQYECETSGWQVQEIAPGIRTEVGSQSDWRTEPGVMDTRSERVCVPWLGELQPRRCAHLNAVRNQITVLRK